MRIEIEIPKEFEEHFKQDKFKDSLERIMADIKHSLENRDCLCAGRYEYETIEMLEKAFENSRQAYSVDKVVEELEDLADENYKAYCIAFNSDDRAEYDAYTNAIEIVKQGDVTKDCNNCANYTEPDEVDNGVVSDDVCEVKQGKWIFDKFTAKYGNPYRCSCCSEEFGDTYNYCPNCGVGMKEVE